MEIAGKFIGAGTASIALLGVAIGIGLIFASLLQSIARNSYIARLLFSYAILGFALTEAIGLFSLMLAFLILYE